MLANKTEKAEVTELVGYRKENLPRYLGRIIPWLCLAAVALALIITFAVGRGDLATRGLSIAIPLALASTIAIVKPDLFQQEAAAVSPAVKGYFRHFAFLFFILFVVNLCLLLSSQTRPLAYFILTAVMAGVILIQILAAEGDSKGQKALILTQIVFLFLGITMGQTLKLPLFFGDTDILGHMGHINFIIEEGHVTKSMLDYQYFPLFHIFNAVGVFITDLPLEQSYFVVSGLMFAFSIPIVYLLTSQITDNNRLPMVATLFYTLMSVIIFAGMYTITRTMAFVIAFLILYLLLRSHHDWRFRALAIFSLIPLVLTHQMTLIFLTIILAIITAVELIMHRRSSKISLSFQILFIVIYLGYWMYLAGPFFSEIVGLVRATSGVLPVPEAGSLQLDWATYMLVNVPLMIIAFIAMLGILGQLRSDKDGKPASVFALVSLIALFFFLPGISDYFIPFFINYRIPFIVAPLIAFAAGSGLFFLTRQWHTSGSAKAWAVLGVVLLVVFSFSTVTILANQTDLDIGNIVGDQNQKYFTESELGSFSFLSEKRGETSTIYSDQETYCYFNHYLRLPSASFIEYLDVNTVKEGYFIYREEEYLTRGRLQFLVPAADVEGFNRDTITIYKLDEGDNPLETWGEQNKIYSNNAVSIYYRPEKIPSTDSY
jgi:hypothetical protein